MKFVDRTDETSRLVKILNTGKSSFIVVYGRRRLGKSTLIKRVLTDNDVYFLSDQSESQHQIAMLAKVIAQTISDFDKVTYPDWESLLRALNYRTTEHFTLCLDEFPYLVEQAAELPSVLQKLLDEKQLTYNILVCGSSQNMMYGLFLDSTAPLYGRADLILKLSPIRIPYIQEALQINDTQAVEEYAVWGGVPRYWELRENCATLNDALWQNVFSSNATLYEEPMKLFQDEVKDIVKISTLMSYIGAGANRLSEIAARSKEPATNLSRPLKKLIDLGFLEREVPYGVEERNAKRSLYKISDPFMSFYFKFIVPNRSFIELDRRAPIQNALNEHFDEYVAMHWEKICRNAVTGNEIKGVLYGKASRWWGTVINSENRAEQVEFDVVAESINKKYLLVGECKWTNPENSDRLTAELMRKARMLPFGKGKTIVPILFLKNKPVGSTNNMMLPTDVIGLSR